jgi:AcrR family transcriptional regulator
MAGSRAAADAKRPGRPLDERVTTAVLRAVLDLATEEGLGAVTMDAVAARAQVGKSAIYRRWPTKQDLIIAAAETRFKALAVPDQGSIRTELHAMLSARLEAYRMPGTDRLVAEIFSARVLEAAPSGRYAAYISKLMSGSRTILERGIARGEVRPDIDLRAVATLVASPLVFRLMAEVELPDGHLVDQVVDLVVRAVAPSA